MDGIVNDYGGPWEYHPGQEEQDHNLEPSAWAVRLRAEATTAGFGWLDSIIEHHMEGSER
jgi:hypothetical protein